MEGKYLPLWEEFNCSEDRHNFSEVVNLSELRDLNSPLMRLELMQLGEVECKLCHKFLRVVRTGVYNGQTHSPAPCGEWQKLTKEALEKFKTLKKRKFK